MQGAIRRNVGTDGVPTGSDKNVYEEGGGRRGGPHDVCVCVCNECAKLSAATDAEWPRMNGWVLFAYQTFLSALGWRAEKR